MSRSVVVHGTPLVLAELPWRQYRKRPVVIRAVQMAEEFEVETLEGLMKGAVGDWLIEGVAGELYPCKPEIFQETYEVAG